MRLKSVLMLLAAAVLALAGFATTAGAAAAAKTSPQRTGAVHRHRRHRRPHHRPRHQAGSPHGTHKPKKVKKLKHKPPTTPVKTPVTPTPPTSTPPPSGTTQPGNPTTQMGAACMTSGDTGPMPQGSWSNDFGSGNFCQWTWWGQGQQNLYGSTSVVTAASAGVPQLHQGSPNVGRMTVTAADAADGSINAKLYEGFGTWSGNTEHEPSNVSGTYSAWYYVPSSYKIPPNTWSNIFQFKEQYQEPDGSQQSDPLWWIQLSNAAWAETYGGATWIGPQPTDPNAPVAVLNYWCNNWTRKVVLEAVPLNQWFNISAVLTQGQSIAFSMAGKPFDTALNSQYAVGPSHSTGDEWIFGVGNYSTAPNTTLYVGNASYSPSN